MAGRWWLKVVCLGFVCLNTSGNESPAVQAAVPVTSRLAPEQPGLPSWLSWLLDRQQSSQQVSPVIKILHRNSVPAAGNSPSDNPSTLWQYLLSYALSGQDIFQVEKTDSTTNQDQKQLATTFKTVNFDPVGQVVSAVSNFVSSLSNNGAVRDFWDTVAKYSPFREGTTVGNLLTYANFPLPTQYRFGEGDLLRMIINWSAFFAYQSLFLRAYVPFPGDVDYDYDDYDDDDDDDAEEAEDDEEEEVMDEEDMMEMFEDMMEMSDDNGDDAQDDNQATGDDAQDDNQATGDDAQDVNQATGDDQANPNGMFNQFDQNGNNQLGSDGQFDGQGQNFNQFPGQSNSQQGQSDLVGSEDTQRLHYAIYNHPESSWHHPAHGSAYGPIYHNTIPTIRGYQDHNSLTPLHPYRRNLHIQQRNFNRPANTRHRPMKNRRNRSRFSSLFRRLSSSYFGI